MNEQQVIATLRGANATMLAELRKLRVKLAAAQNQRDRYRAKTTEYRARLLVTQTELRKERRK